MRLTSCRTGEEGGDGVGVGGWGWEDSSSVVELVKGASNLIRPCG